MATKNTPTISNMITAIASAESKGFEFDQKVKFEDIYNGSLEYLLAEGDIEDTYNADSLNKNKNTQHMRCSLPFNKNWWIDGELNFTGHAYEEIAQDFDGKLYKIIWPVTN